MKRFQVTYKYKSTGKCYNEIVDSIDKRQAEYKLEEFLKNRIVITWTEIDMDDHSKLIYKFEDLIKQERDANISEYFNQNYVDCALCHALKKWKDNLPPLDDYFHKAFRQIDVTDCGHADMILWNLINASDLFWKALETVRKEKK